MKYIVIDCRECDVFTSEYDSREKAVTEARYQWGILSEYDKKKRSEFYVLESVNPNPDAENHFDGYVVIRMK